MKLNKKVIGWLTSGIISILLLNFGIAIIKEERYIGIITVLIAVALLYVSYYAPQIQINEFKIKKLEEWIEGKEEILNTLKDIVILKKVSKIK